jgi:hypothetical protein
MNIKIKKDKEVKRFKLINDWSDVTLGRWIKLIKLKGLSKTKEAKETIAALSDIPKNLIDKLALKDIVVLMSKLSEMQENKGSSLKNIISVEGNKYGFHPDLDSITLGEYADLETFLKDGVENNLPELMAILYRPIVEETSSGVYTIDAYDGNISIRAEEMKKMSAEQVQSALVFFYHLGRELLMTLPFVLTEQQKEMTQLLHQIHSQKSGVGLE